MNEENLENITAKFAALEKELDATIDLVGRLVKAIDQIRSDEARFSFETDLVKHCLCEAGSTH